MWLCSICGNFRQAHEDPQYAHQNNALLQPAKRHHLSSYSKIFIPTIPKCDGMGMFNHSIMINKIFPKNRHYGYKGKKRFKKKYPGKVTEELECFEQGVYLSMDLIFDGTIQLCTQSH